LSISNIKINISLNYTRFDFKKKLKSQHSKNEGCESNPRPHKECDSSVGISMVLGQ